MPPDGGLIPHRIVSISWRVVATAGIVCSLVWEVNVEVSEELEGITRCRVGLVTTIKGRGTAFLETGLEHTDCFSGSGVHQSGGAAVLDGNLKVAQTSAQCQQPFFAGVGR